MEQMKALVEDRKFIIAAGGGLLLAGIYHVYNVSFRRKPRTFPPNVVGLHQIGRGPKAPSLSPFPLKLETYLRMAKIPYENEHEMRMSSKGKTPWITYNGEAVTDSQFCVEFLNDKFDVDLDKHLTGEQKATARAFQKMVEENFYWCIALWRWVYDKEMTMMKRVLKMPSLILWYIQRLVEKQARGQGMGRHSMEEVCHIGELDMKALSTFLADKQFLMGDEPCESDAAIFGMLAQVKWHGSSSPFEEMILHKYSNLSEYCDRMKERFWPDWDDCTTRGGTQEATN